VVDLVQLSVPQRLLVFRLGDGGVVGHLDVKDVVRDGVGGAEGSDEEGCLEGFLGGEELDGEVLVGLCTDQLRSLGGN
jgi:hypothetical protein